MSYTLPFTDKVIELGGGDNPLFHPNIDIKAGPNVDVIADFNKKLPIADKSYNGVFSKYCLEYISWQNVKQFLAEIYRILNNNGKVVFITRNAEKEMQQILDQEHWADDSHRMLFGDQEVKKNIIYPKYAIQLLTEAGFDNVVILPWHESETDMVIEAKKTVNEVVFNREYFDNPNYYGNPNQGMYRDHPKNWIIFNKIMELKPESVLELGCGRGYIVKRLESYGISAKGLDISEHCYLTRVTNNVTKWDITKTPWHFKDKEFDVCFSDSVLDHINKADLPNVLKEIDRVTKRGIHAVNFNCEGLNQHFLRSEILESGSIAHNVPFGDNKVKLNIGSFTVMFHHGWINTDIINISGFAAENQYKFIPLDVRQPLTFKDNTVELITSSHMLEHLTYDEGLCFLKECHRVMRSGAVMRIAVPDAELLTNYYKNNQLQILDEINLVAAQNSSQSFKLWSFLFEGHKIAYDWNSLKQIGNEAGFHVERRYFNQGHPQIIKETMDFLPELSIYVEMTKN